MNTTLANEPWVQQLLSTNPIKAEQYGHPHGYWVLRASWSLTCAKFWGAWMDIVTNAWWQHTVVSYWLDTTTNTIIHLHQANDQVEVVVSIPTQDHAAA